jgi:hypothetical protein
MSPADIARAVEAYDDGLAQIAADAANLAEYARQQAFQDSLPGVWRENREHERGRLTDAAEVDDSALIRATAHDLAAIYAQAGGR